MLADVNENNVSRNLFGTKTWNLGKMEIKINILK